jgi:hypothetical protein
VNEPRRAYREENERNGQSTLDFCTGSEEEQSGETDLLDIQPNKGMLNSLGEEQPSGITTSGLIQLPEEEILPYEIEQSKRDKRQSIDDRRDQHVSERDDDEECDGGEQRAEENIAKIVFDRIHTAGRASEEEQLDIINDERGDL